MDEKRLGHIRSIGGVGGVEEHGFIEGSDRNRVSLYGNGTSEVFEGDSETGIIKEYSWVIHPLLEDPLVLR